MVETQEQPLKNKAHNRTQKPREYGNRVVTHPGIAPASNSLNFGVLTNPKPVSSHKASHYLDARCAI
ncbi:hypothetical protein L3X38_015828 [Prunus dulcis]|uniref:Uncharacterized protein n=1 Tax=Prunus dulcis TaxID=3755 RepID=A0AAD4W455_PRUDU|nr:hypothetical protein L3X38_015828 [Prunus dulcis]